MNEEKTRPQVRKSYRGLNNEMLYLIISNERELNALTTQMQIELIDELKAAKRDKTVRVIIIRGEGDHSFSSGGAIGNLHELKSDEARDQMYQRGVEVRETIAAMDKPVLAAVCGYCIGAGFEIAMCCDMIYAAEGSKFGLPEIDLGLVPGWGGAIRLPRKITVNRAKEMILLGEKISAEEAWRLSIVNKVFPKDVFFHRVDEIADMLLRKPPLAVKGVKAIVSNGIVDGNISVAQEIEHRLSIFLMATEDFNEAIYAFEEKRPGNFSGK